MTGKWINPEDRMPEDLDVARYVEITRTDGSKHVKHCNLRNCLVGEPPRSAITGWQPLPEPSQPVKRVVWLNFYDNAHPSEHDTKEAADSYDGFYDNMIRIACVRVEFEEGEGL